MSRARWVPDRGDLIWINFTPQAGHEQAGHRPALVLSPRVYNQKTGLALMCPVTSSVKGYPFEVALPKEGPVVGVVLADQLRNLDWKARRATHKGRASGDVVREVIDKAVTLFQ